MNEPEWLDIDIVLDFHAEQLALFGGADGMRDRGLLESALARPINKFGYGETDLAGTRGGLRLWHRAQSSVHRRQQADGAGCRSSCFSASTESISMRRRKQATAMILGLAAGEISEEVLARWIARSHRPLDAPGIAP